MISCRPFPEPTTTWKSRLSIFKASLIYAESRERNRLKNHKNNIQEKSSHLLETLYSFGLDLKCYITSWILIKRRSVSWTSRFSVLSFLVCCDSSKNKHDRGNLYSTKWTIKKLLRRLADCWGSFVLHSRKFQFGEVKAQKHLKRPIYLKATSLTPNYSIILEWPLKCI